MPPHFLLTLSTHAVIDCRAVLLIDDDAKPGMEEAPGRLGV